MSTAATATMCEDTVIQSPATVGELHSTSTTPSPQGPKIPVDRHWISKLLQRYPNPNTRNPHKALVVAPMVDQSDLPFRMLCRKYGANLCFTPMIHSKLVLNTPAYTKKFTGKWLPEDRPLIAQLCGSDPDAMLQAARLVEPYVDGIDINCGCPQGIAKRGDYGAFLLEQEDKLLKLVKHLLANLSVPLSVKVRLLPDPETNPHKLNDPSHPKYDTPKHSLALFEKLVDAGVHLLTIHGRTRKQKQLLVGHSDWETIRIAVERFGDRIPIFANGSIENYEDVEECLRVTKADGIMSSESLLEYPPIFYKIPQSPPELYTRTIGRLQLSKEYMALATQHPPELGGQGSGLKCIRAHLHRFLHEDLQEDLVFRKKIVSDFSYEALEESVRMCQEKQARDNHEVKNERLSWYRRHRHEPRDIEQHKRYELLQSQQQGVWDTNRDDDIDDDVDECGDLSGGNFFGACTMGDDNESGDY